MEFAADQKSVEKDRSCSTELTEHVRLGLHLSFHLRSAMDAPCWKKGDGTSMIIRTTANSIYCPVPGQQVAVIRESGRARYLRNSLLVKTKSVKNQ